MDFLVQKLLEKRKRKSRRQSELIVMEQSLKSGLHVYQFWTSSADNAVSPPFNQFRIYLTVDETVYPFLIAASAGAFLVTLSPYKILLNSPLVTYTDTFLTVCANMQWRSLEWPSTTVGTMKNAKDWLIDWSTTRTAAQFGVVPPVSSPYDWQKIQASGPNDWKYDWLGFPIRDYIRWIGTDVYTKQYRQDYLEACESQTSDNIIDENRLEAGFHLGFYAMMGIRAPDGFNPEEQLNIDWNVFNEGIIVYSIANINQNASSPIYQQIVSMYSAWERLTGYGNYIFCILGDTYQSYVYSSATKQNQDLTKEKLPIRRQKWWVEPTSYFVQQLASRKTLPYMSGVTITVGNQRFNLVGMGASRTPGKMYIFLTQQALTAIVSQFGLASFDINIRFKTVEQWDQSSTGNYISNFNPFGGYT